MGNCLKPKKPAEKQTGEFHGIGGEQPPNEPVYNHRAADPKKGTPLPQIRKNINIEDLVFNGKTGETLIKAPGTIDGELFKIENCKDCTIYLCDNLDSIYVDD
jgi:hypothetical protein